MIEIEKPKIETVELNEDAKYGKFVIEPLERGYGTTLDDDGGWGYNPGSPSDANSTAVVNGALARAGVPLADLTKAGGKTPYTALQTFALPCGGEDGGAFAYQPDKTGKLAANADATAAAVLGSMGKGMAAGNYNAVKAPVCTKGDGLTPEQSAQNGASYLAKALAASSKRGANILFFAYSFSTARSTSCESVRKETV
ncbi:hypothetical protein ACPA31_28615, partial [Bacillus bombysepticus]